MSFLTPSASPIINYLGGKRRLLPEILPLVPLDFETYYEPFVGGAAVFLTLQPERAVLGDLNPEVINLYRVVAENPRAIAETLKDMTLTEETFERFKEQDPETLDPFRRAVRFVYLTKAGYGCVYRVNSKGKYNIQFNQYVAGISYWKDKGRWFFEAASAFSKATILLADYETTLSSVTSNDFVFLDPPYVPVSMTASFTSYTKESFDHQRFADFVHDLDRRGVRFLLTNSNTEAVRQLYHDFDIREVEITRHIAAIAGKCDCSELIIKNY